MYNVFFKYLNISRLLDLSFTAPWGATDPILRSTGLAYPGQGPVARSYEHRNEPSGNIKGGELLDKMSDFQLLKRSLLHGDNNNNDNNNNNNNSTTSRKSVNGKHCKGD
jgi:hypothetical protein